MSEITDQLRAAASGLTPPGAMPAAELPALALLLCQAADRLDAADLETLWMFERIRDLVRHIERHARKQYGPSQQRFLAAFPRQDPEGHAAWKAARELLLFIEGEAARIRAQHEERGTPPQLFRSDWIEEVMAVGIAAMMERRQE